MCYDILLKVLHLDFQLLLCPSHERFPSPSDNNHDYFETFNLFRRGSIRNDLFFHRLVSKEGKEDVVSDLDGVDVEQTLGRRDEGKVDSCQREKQNKTYVRRHPFQTKTHTSSHGNQTYCELVPTQPRIP